MSTEQKLKLIRQNPQAALREDQKSVIVPFLGRRIRLTTYRP